MSAQNDILIGNFMGLLLIEGINFKGNKYYYYNNPIMEDFESLPDYDSDWNELMKVVEKIEEIYVFNYSGYLLESSDSIKNFEEMMKLTKTGFFINNQMIYVNTDIKEVYKAVVIFIEWYNNNIF